MPASEAIFDAKLRTFGLGGRYPHDTPTDEAWIFPYDTVITTIDVELERFRSSPQCLRPLPAVCAGIANCTRVDACAFLDDDTYYIAICQGVFRLLKATFLRLLSRPDVFPWLGNVANITPRTDVPRLPRDATALTPAYLPSSMDPIRNDVAAWMLVEATRFIYLHEVRHIIGGHVDYLRTRRNAALIKETVSTAGAPSANTISQALEVDADSFATVTLLAHYFSPTPVFSFNLPFLAGCQNKASKLLNLELSAILAVHKLFGSPLSPYDHWDRFDHPPAEVRRAALLLSSQRHLRDWGHTELADSPDAILEAAGVIDGALHEIFGDAPSTDEWRRDFEPGGRFVSYFLELNNVCISMHNELAPFAYLGTAIR
jgi:hypothetical protein